MNVDNVKSQMRKGMLEYCIMLLLHKEPAYASDIIQKLKEARLIVVEGTNKVRPGAPIQGKPVQRPSMADFRIPVGFFDRIQGLEASSIPFLFHHHY